MCSWKKEKKTEFLNQSVKGETGKQDEYQGGSNCKLTKSNYVGLNYVVNFGLLSL